jgi:hypothetical protein
VGVGGQTCGSGAAPHSQGMCVRGFGGYVCLRVCGGGGKEGSEVKGCGHVAG